LDRFGATRQLDLLTGELTNNFEVHVAVLDAESSLAGLFDANTTRAFHFLGASGPSNNVRSLTRSGLRLRKLIRKLQPNIIHAWCQPAERVALAASVDFNSAKKFVTELHVRPSTNMTMEAIDQRLGKDVVRYVASHEVVRQSLTSHQYREEKIEIIPSAIGRLTFDRETARRKLLQLGGLGEHFNVAGAVAPLVPRSRLKDLIWATDLLTCIRDDVHFFIFGRGTQRWRLEKFAFQTEAGHHVHFIDSEMHAAELIPGLDFFWQSHLNEPLPSAMVHAMQNNVPVVSNYGAGTSELITPQETGFATNFGARDEFARWTKFLLEKTDSAKQLAEQGRASLEGRYPVAEMANAYRDVYNRS
jgi:glycosyltransferase involved in cell wall biosynthesis